LLERASATIMSVAELFRQHWPTSAAVYLPHGAVPNPGTLFVKPALAQTYNRLLQQANAASSDRVEQIEAARRCWAEGFVAAAIDRFCRTQELMDSNRRPHVRI